MSKLAGRIPHQSYPAVGAVVTEMLANAPTEEPPRPQFTAANIFDPETDYERWLYAEVWRNPATGIQKRREFVAGLPVLEGPEDYADILPPGATGVQPPRHWLTTPIHFTPLADPHYARILYSGGGRYTFNNQERVGVLLRSLTEGLQPKRILDVGTGLGPTAFACAEIFPQAEVVAVDLSPHMVRLDRMNAQRKGVSNIDFYLQHGGDTIFEAESFDIVSESYVLHEQPVPESTRIVMEMKRLVKPGGMVFFADVIYDETEEGRQARVQRNKGPEPFMGEYMKLNLPALLEREFHDVQALSHPDWDCMVWTATK